MLLYYITDRQQFAGDEVTRRRQLLEKISEAARAGVDYIQLRERDLTSRDLLALASEALTQVRAAKTSTKLLINSRIDVALAAGAEGVHLRSNDLPASEARAIWSQSTARPDCIIAASCHTLHDVLAAEGHGADLVVFGPVFSKLGSNEPPVGLEQLRHVAQRGTPPDKKVEAGQSLHMPVIALGGVTLDNAHACVQAGAAGIAAIRLFQENDISQIVSRLR